jgi:ABC-type glutathione transport system ATPase component
LADEPTGALDSKTGHELLALFDELHDQGITLVVVTHDIGVAHRAERIVTLLDGEIIEDRLNVRSPAEIQVPVNGAVHSNDQLVAQGMARQNIEQGEVIREIA